MILRAMSSNIHSLFCTLITEYWLVKIIITFA
nr:MAG TPA: hypothetical protein [Bacteriophage sp.]